MKAIEIENQINITDDECKVCAIHEAADKLMPDVQCPHCNESIDRNIEWFSGHEWVIVGETNIPEPDEQVLRMPVIMCASCDKQVALRPIKVNYNGNHDIYYTGGSKYLMDEKIQLPDSIVKSFKDFTSRIKEGEDLSARNLQTWTERAIEEYIATTLKSHGLKF